ncbi:hypothetical protein OJF2_19330 [Aquisphaera giovannonii]|uniref:Uncharacterized protein n=1 Tax=Aquisphaera giovannonii TaxID=406548 RepID=A0A5B9VZM6_9BACT|nr:hypothetical protein [Aquisphaera giovannonii]QEH33431.1 hypothetical protein OJF2_19330 [Aquisphaera giovannonii]
MATVEQGRKREVASQDSTPPLENGERLSRVQFERIVDIHSPVRPNRHGLPASAINCWLANYRIATPGLVSALSPGLRLDLDNEPQQDALLMFAPDHGGQAVVSADDDVEGPPERVAEVSRSATFPGLRLDAKALASAYMARMRARLVAGLAGPEHAEFVRVMAARAGQGPA